MNPALVKPLRVSYKVNLPQDPVQSNDRFHESPPPEWNN
jgi:hypothetical protein